MSYVIKTNSRSTNRFPWPLRIVLLVVLFILAFHFLAPSALSSFFTMIVRPFWNIENNVRYGESFVDVSDLIKENEELKKKAEENKNNYLSFNLIKKENEELKNILGRGVSENFVLAEILKKPPFSAYDIFILDIGKNDGIDVGNKVYALGYVPIGEIAEVSGRTSKVKLYSSSGEKWNVIIGENNIEAVATGKGGGTFEATVPRDTKIFKGDVVSIPTFSHPFLGVVESIVSEPSHPFSLILFHQPINIYEMRWVEVEKSSK